jgi:hypothetical protein
MADFYSQFFAVTEQSNVAFTSPIKTTQLGFSTIKTFSNSIIVLPTCSACVPDPTPKLYYASGMPNSSKKESDIFLSLC